MQRFVQRHIDRIMATAEGSYGDRIVHVDYYALVKDPVSIMLRVHNELGIDSPAAVRAAVANWHRANPKNRRGANEYSFEEYGLDENAIAERFGDYMRRFDIPRESKGLARI
jgi:hypothetical protein